MNTKSRASSCASLLLVAVAALSVVVSAPVHADEAGSAAAPAKLSATDKAQLQAHLGQSVTVEGKVTHAAWSKSGAVCNVNFEGDAFVVAIFKKNKDKLDEAFNGDVAKTLDGATVRLSGKLAKYGGRDERLSEAAQIIVSMPNQITVLTPATQPGNAAGPVPTTEPAKP